MKIDPRPPSPSSFRDWFLFSSPSPSPLGVGIFPHCEARPWRGQGISTLLPSLRLGLPTWAISNSNLIFYSSRVRVGLSGRGLLLNRVNRLNFPMDSMAPSKFIMKKVFWLRKLFFLGGSYDGTMSVKPFNIRQIFQRIFDKKLTISLAILKLCILKFYDRNLTFAKEISFRHNIPSKFFIIIFYNFTKFKI